MNVLHINIYKWSIGIWLVKLLVSWTIVVNLINLKTGLWSSWSSIDINNNTQGRREGRYQSTGPGPLKYTTKKLNFGQHFHFSHIMFCDFETRGPSILSGTGARSKLSLGLINTWECFFLVIIIKLISSNRKAFC